MDAYAKHTKTKLDALENFVINPSSSICFLANKHAENGTTIETSIDHPLHDRIAIFLRLFFQGSIKEARRGVVSLRDVMLLHDLSTHYVALVMEAEKDGSRHNEKA